MSAQSAKPGRPQGSPLQPAVLEDAARALSLHVKQLNIEDQRGVRRDDAAGAARAVTEFGRDDERALAADLHGRHTLIPTADDLPPADGKLERLAAID